MKSFVLLLATATVLHASPTREYVEAIRLLGPLPADYVRTSFEAAAARSPEAAQDPRIVLHAVTMDNGRILESRRIGELSRFSENTTTFSAHHPDVTVNVSVIPADATQGPRFRYYVSLNDTWSTDPRHHGRMIGQSSGTGSLPRPGGVSILCQGVLQQESRDTLQRPHQLHPVLLVVATGGMISPEIDGPKVTSP